MTKFKKTVLVFDWSNMSFRSLFTSQIFGNASSYNTEEEINSFIAKMATDISLILRTYNPNNVVFAVDAINPWRKDFLEDQEIGYKGQREKDKNMNWDNIYKGLDDFRKVMEEKGFNFAYTERAEADDLMALTKESVFKKYPDMNVVIVSSDADIRQLVEFDPQKEQYCLVFNPIGSGKGGKKKLYMNSECKRWFETKDKVDIFFSNLNPGKEFIKNALNKDKKIEIVEIDPNKVVLEKIFCGDAGDNVPSFYEYYGTNGKKRRISEKKFESLCEQLCIQDVEDLLNKEFMLKDTIEKIMKKELDDVDCSDRLNRQRHLVELNSELFPENIRNYMADIIIMLSEDYKNPNNIRLSSIKMVDILVGSRFFKIIEKKKAKAADIFKDIDKYADQINGIKLF